MAPERKVSPHTLEENAFPRISLTTMAKGLLEDLTKCEDCVRVATYTDTVVKTQCTYTLDSPLSPGGLFINLSTFLPVSLDALPLDCLLKTAAGNSVRNSPAAAAAARPGSLEHQQQQRQSGRQADENSSSSRSKESSSSEKNSSNKESRSNKDSRSEKDRSKGCGAGALMVLKPQQRLYVHIQSSVDRDQAVSVGRVLLSGNKKDSGDEEDAAARPLAAEEGVGKTIAGAAAVGTAAAAAKVPQQQLAPPTKLALGIEGGFAVEEECSSGDACPAALSRTFQYCLALLPQQLRLRAAVLPCAAAAGDAVVAAAAPAGSTPLSLYSRWMACCCSSSNNEDSSKEEMQQLLQAQETWERQLLQQITFLPLDSADIPEKIRTACNAIVEHRGSSAPAAAATAGGAVAWEEEVKISKYAATLEQIAHPPAIGPTGWRCGDCGAVSNLWLNLSDGFIGCGRKLYGVGGGCLDGREGAAIRHYLETAKKYPLIVKLGTITPHSADVYSYAADEDCCVIDPLLPEHLSHFGVNIQQLSKTEKSTNEIAFDWNVQHEWSRATEADTQLRACRGADFVGLRNLGNSCYINSVVQVLTSIPELREKYVSLFPVLLASLPLEKDSSSNSKKTAFAAAVDFLLQHSSLAVALHTSRYPLQDRRRKAAIVDHAKKLFSAAHAQKTLLPSACADVIDDTNDAFRSVAYLDTDSVTPQLYRHLVGTQHSEFATLHQQDAEEFLSLLLQWLSCRDAEARERLLEAKRRLRLMEATSQQQQQQGEEEEEVMELVAAAGCTAVDTMRAEKALEKSSLEKLFSFAVEQRIQCSVTQQVRYSYTRQQVLALPVPMDPAVQERFEEQQQLLQQQQRKKRQRSSGDELREDEAAAAAAAAEGGAQQKTAAAARAAADKQETETDEAPSLPSYTFSECIAAFLAPTVLSDYHSSATGKRGEAVKQVRLASFPPYLVVQLKRFFADQHWQAKKLYCPVLVSEELDVENMRGCGLQEGEIELPEDEGVGGKRRRDQAAAAAGGEASLKSSSMQFDPELLIQLTSMGFTENACKRACLAVQSSSPDACIEWIMAHLNDDDLNDPLPSHGTSTAGPTASSNGEAAADSTAEAVVATLTSMGFTEKQARAGLLAVRSVSGGSSTAAACDRAADWLLNHSDNLDAAVETVLKEAEEKKEAEQKARLQHDTATQEATREEAESNIPPLKKIMKGLDDGGSQYTLHAFITHMGKNASCGHYVGHIKRGDKWILFNDEKVAEAVNPPVDLGYIYVFKRKDLR